MIYFNMIRKEQYMLLRKENIEFHAIGIKSTRSTSLDFACTIQVLNYLHKFLVRRVSDGVSTFFVRHDAM